MDKIKRASLTVEAAALMGLVLLVIFSVLFMEFYVMDRDWLTISAYEAAITGGMAERMKAGSSRRTAEERGRMLGNTGFFGLQDLTLGVTGGTTVKVTYTGNVSSVMGGYQAGLSCEGKYKVVEPAQILRNIRALKRAGSVVTGGK